MFICLEPGVFLVSTVIASEMAKKSRGGDSHQRKRSLLHSAQTGCGAHPVSFPREKEAGCRADPSPVCDAKVQIGPPYVLTE
jgi:hypothetical protein